MTSLDFLAILLLVSSSAVMAAHVCQLGNRGRLTTFTNETVRVSLPCSYRLAKITCGQVDLRVYVKNDLSHRMNGYFAPSAIRVKMTEDGKTYIGRTTTELLSSAIRGRKDSPWKEVQGDLVPDTQSLVGDTATLKRGPVSVCVDSNDPHVRVQCDSDTFRSAPIDKALCGDGVEEKEFKTLRTSLFGEKARKRRMGRQHVLHYLVLSSTINQGDTCNDWAQTFKNCRNKTRAMKKCVGLFDNANVVGGFGKRKLVFYLYTICLKFNCGTASC